MCWGAHFQNSDMAISINFGRFLSHHRLISFVDWFFKCSDQHCNTLPMCKSGSTSLFYDFWNKSNFRKAVRQMALTARPTLLHQKDSHFQEDKSRQAKRQTFGILSDRQSRKVDRQFKPLDSLSRLADRLFDFQTVSVNARTDWSEHVVTRVDPELLFSCFICVYSATSQPNTKTYV